MTIKTKYGINTGHYKAYSPGPISANLSHHGEYDSNDPNKGYDLEGMFEGGFVVGIGMSKHLPMGEYRIENHGGADARVYRYSNGSLVATVQSNVIGFPIITSDPGGFVILGAEAHRVGIYPPGSLPGDVIPRHEAFTLSEDFKRQVAPLHSVRLNPAAVNNNRRLDGWTDRANDWNNPHTHTAIARQLGKPIHVQIPHMELIEDTVLRLQVYADACSGDSSLRITVEPSNEVWNGGFKQHRDIGDRFGHGFAEWTRAFTGYGVWLANIARACREDIGTLPEGVRLMWASQSDNPDVAEQIIAAADSHWLPWKNVFTDYAIGPYMAIDGGLAGHDPKAYLRIGLARLATRLSEHRAIADRLGHQLDGYEGGEHFAPVPSGRRYELQEFLSSVEMYDIQHEFFGIVGGVFDEMIVYNFAHPDNMNGGDGDWSFWTSNWGDPTPKGDALIDVARLAPADPEPGVLDINRDGVVDYGDVHAFAAGFTLNELWADWNKDGVRDNGDIQGFLAAYFAATGGAS